MRIFDRYVAGQFVRLFALFTAAAPTLFILGDLTDNLQKYQQRSLTGGEVALGYLYQLPLFVLWSLPIAALIATVFTVNGMTRHSEVAAAKAGGVSFHRLFLPLPFVGIALTAFGLVLSEVVPIANERRAVLMHEVSPLNTTREDFVYRSRDGSVFEIRRLVPEARRIYDLVIEREGDEPTNPGEQVVAKQAVYTPGEGWLLSNGYLRLFYGEGQERTVEFAQLQDPGFQETPEELLARPREPEQMRYAELGRFIEILRRSGGKPLKLEVEQAQKIALPIATLVIILFAAPLATSSRRGGAAYGVGVSLAVTIVYLMLFKIAGAAGASGTLNPYAAAWLPNALFTAAGLGLLARVKT